MSDATGRLPVVPVVPGRLRAEHRRFNPDETEVTIRNVASLGQVWSSELAGTERPASFVTEPIVADGRVYVSRSTVHGLGGRISVSARDAGTGAEVWVSVPAATLS